MFLPFTASRSCCLSASGILLFLKSTEFSALLTWSIPAKDCAPVAPTPLLRSSSVSRVLLDSSASLRAAVPSSPMLLALKSADFSALLIFGTIPFHEGKSGHKLVNIGRMQTKSISNNTKAASGSTYNCGSAAVMALALPALISLSKRSRLISALLNSR